MIRHILRSLWLVASVGLTPAFAAASAPTPDVSIQMAMDGVVRITLNARKDESCDGAYDDTSPSAGLEGEWIMAELQSRKDFNGWAVARLLKGLPIECATVGSPKRRLTVGFEILNDLIARVPATSELKDAREIAWYGWDSPLYQGFARSAGDALKCEFKNRGTTVEGCTLRPSLGPEGGRVLTFASSADLTAVTEIVVSPARDSKTDTARKLIIRVLSCTYQPTAPMRHLYRDAAAQILALTASEQCISRLRATKEIALTAGNYRVDATVRQTSANATRDAVHLEVMRIPKDIGVQRHTFELKGAGGAFIGTAAVDVRERGLTVGVDAAGKPKLAITFGNKEYLDAWHSHEATDGIAVTSYSEVKKEGRRDANEELYVENTVEVDPDDDLEFAARGIAEQRSASPTDASEFAWQIRSTSAVGAWVSYSTNDGDWWDHTAGHDDLSRLTFAAFKASPSPLTVDVRLVDVNANGEVLFSSVIEIAKRARAESLPMPIQNLFYVVCGDDSDVVIDPTWEAGQSDHIDVVRHGQIRAVEDSDVSTGQCKVVYDPERLEFLTGSRQKKDRMVLRHFGVQDIHVSVSRDGDVAGEHIWRIDPTKRETLTLSHVEGLADETGPYTVRATLNGLRLPDVVYRPSGTEASKPAEADRALGAFEFVAGLRPRGNQGWVALPIRTFVTIPLDIFGYRLPADPQRLETSSDSPHIQAVSLKAGIAFVVEPWNYHTGSNPWAVPLRLVSGFHLYDISREEAAPSFITGVSAAFPLLELPDGAVQNQLGTDLTVSGYWEMSLEQSIGHHFLLTFGANFLSLFGSK